MSKRKCFNCGKHVPPETEHFEIDDEVYCSECVEVIPYTAYQYYIDGEFKGDSEHDDRVNYVYSLDDEYEED